MPLMMIHGFSDARCALSTSTTLSDNLQIQCLKQQPSLGCINYYLSTLALSRDGMNEIFFLTATITTLLSFEKMMLQIDVSVVNENGHSHRVEIKWMHIGNFKLNQFTVIKLKSHYLRLARRFSNAHAQRKNFHSAHGYVIITKK